MAKPKLPPFETEHWPEGTAIVLDDVIKLLGVSRRTVERYIERGLLKRWKNKANNHIYYDKAQVMSILGCDPRRINKENILYCRAGIFDNPGPGLSAQNRVEEQAQRMIKYCTLSGIKIHQVIIETRASNDLGSTPELDNIIERVLRKEVGMLVVETRDRLGRFDTVPLWERFFQWHGVHFHVANEVLPLEEYREEIKGDLADIIYQAKVLLGEIKA